ncbi:glycine cleavage system protein H [Blattabacterium cuenoti]|uniref:glycine cleavage system protein H n=1 Tax=Blattabacterium cuenoti TaxID=1653831 RepID=UPI00163B736A|nr:glycine cleavage system protein H [Blattabacterium cuenoti]
MNPNNLKYSKNHEWIQLDNNNHELAYIGISFFAKNELGDIIYLDIDSTIIGKKIKEGNLFGSIETVKSVSDLFMPVSGIILKINQNLLSKPEKIKQNNEEWLLKITVLDKKEYDQLMSLSQYKKYLENK